MDPMATDVDQHELAQQILAKAREEGIELAGPDGLLNRLTKNVLRTRWKRKWTNTSDTGDMTCPGVGAETPATEPREDWADRDRPVEIDVPRDTGSTFDPQIVKKRRR